MGVVRLRHSSGVTSLQVPFDDDTFKVSDLQAKIVEVTGISASSQQLKAGYPPRDLHLVAELPVSSLGLRSGDQIILTAAQPPPAPTPTPAPAPRPAPPISAPTPAPARAPTKAKATGPVHVATADGSFIVHRVVPDDNSCLFSSIALIFNSSPPKIRQIVADAIQRDPETYSEPILGMPPSQYISTILKPSTWGGAIELSILANHFNTQIDSIDVESGRIDHFESTNTSGTGTASSTSRCLLLYSGIHYDAATLAPMPDADAEWHQTVFPITSKDDNADPIIIAAKKLATILRANRQYTNTATFDLRCEQCNQGLKGEKGARAHAEQTGHTRFGEY